MACVDHVDDSDFEKFFVDALKNPGDAFVF